MNIEEVQFKRNYFVYYSCVCDNNHRGGGDLGSDNTRTPTKILHIQVMHTDIRLRHRYFAQTETTSSHRFHADTYILHTQILLTQR